MGLLAPEGEAPSAIKAEILWAVGAFFFFFGRTCRTVICS